VGAQFVYRDQVGVVEGAGGARFLLEAAQALLVSRDGRRQHLYGDVAVEVQIAGTVHFAHSTRADLLDDFVLIDFLANHRDFTRVKHRRRSRATSAGSIPPSS
jgi:hypothetical protein